MCQRLLTLIALAAQLALAPSLHAGDVGATFVYEGRLWHAGEPLAASADLQFRLFDSAEDGQRIGEINTLLHAPVIQGRFTAKLNFGEDAFDGQVRWLEIRLREPAGSGPWLTLEPRQRIHAVPYALFAVRGGEGGTGPQGPAGPEGPAGAQGPAGADGPAGPVGAPGDDGAQGLQGDTGPPGPIGPAGSQGPTGTQGATGATGATGADGPTGPAGNDGAQGPTGPQGPQGLQGTQGNQGPQGDPGPQGATGPAGPAGPQGNDGAQGATGPQGPQGDPGPEGDPGPQGAIGATGPAGDDGAQGATGPQGPQGDPGPEGDPGPQGAIGAAGPAGDDGAQGATGPQGPQGDPGPEGDPGPQGATGAAGPAGDDGAQGPTGPQGPPGDPAPPMAPAIFIHLINHSTTLELTTSTNAVWKTAANNSFGRVSALLDMTRLGAPTGATFVVVYANTATTGTNLIGLTLNSAPQPTGTTVTPLTSSEVTLANSSTFPQTIEQELDVGDLGSTKQWLQLTLNLESSSIGPQIMSAALILYY